MKYITPITSPGSLMRLRNKGFTLVELLIVIAIVAIMATIALPNMSQWIASRRAASKAEQVANLLRFARTEAVRLNTIVYVCPVQIRKDATPNVYCNADHAEQGLAAFADNNKTDNNKKGLYQRGEDIDLRTVILNSPDKDNPKKLNKKIAYQVSTHNFSAESTGKDLIWGFMPDGTFGHKANADDKLNPSTGFVKISLTDAAAVSEADKKARSTIVILDSAGRATVCSGNSDGSTNTTEVMKNLCQYESASQ